MIEQLGRECLVVPTDVADVAAVRAAIDASINRLAAWVIGTRCLLKALLMALLEPIDTLRQYEREGDLTGRLALLEELKTQPYGAVWDQYCRTSDVPVGPAWLDGVRTYERDVLSIRS